MTDGVVDIGYVELFSASALMLVAGLVSWKLELGQTRRIAVSSVRCFVQLLAAGFLLTYLFEFQDVYKRQYPYRALAYRRTNVSRETCGATRAG